MSFSKWLISACMAVVISSCGLKIGEKPAEVKPIHVGKVGFGCMSNISKTIHSYVLAELNASQVTYFFDCMKFSFVSFGEYVRGERRDSYAATEIREFLQNYFIRDRKISDALLEEFMNLKKVMVGGKTDRVTKAELQRGIEVLEEIKEEALKLNPYIPVLNSYVGVQLKAEGVQLPPTMEAIRALNEAAKRIGQIMATSHQNYNFENLERFLVSFRDFVQWDQQFLNAKSPQKWVEFFRVFKALSVRPSKNVVEPQEWPRLMSSVSGWYSLYLRYIYEYQGRSMFYGKGLAEVKGLFLDSMALLFKSVEDQPHQVIPFQYLDELFDVLGDLELLPMGIKAETLKSVSRPLVLKIFGDLGQASEHRLTTGRGITWTTLQNIQSEFARWYEIQWNLDQVFPRNEKPNYVIDEKTDLKNNSFFNKESQELRRIWEHIRPFFRDSEYRVFLVEQSKLLENGVRQNPHNLSLMNLMRAGVSLVLRGYTQDVGRFARFEGLTEDELESFYVDFKALGIDLKLMDPRGQNVGRRAFIEANLFTYLGNGINLPNPKDPLAHLFSYEEGIEFLSIITSGALTAQELQKDLRAVCPEVGKDVYGDPAVGRDCFRQNLRSLLVPKLTFMPGMQKFLLEASPDVWSKFSEALIRAALNKSDPNAKIVEIGELSTFCVVLHYVEVIMTRYNLDGDEFLTNEEVEKAFPVFDSMIKKVGKNLMCKDLSNWESRGAFGYILTYKELPLSSTAQFNVLWSRTISDWDYKLDRLGVAEVFGTIMQAIVSPKNGALQCK